MQIKQVVEMVTHEDVMECWLVRDEMGNVLQVNTEQPAAPKLVLTEQSVSPEWFNVLRASGTMYQQLTRQFEALQSLIDISEQVGASEQLVSIFIELQNAILLTQQVAREGVEKVSAVIDKETKLS